MAHSLIDRSTWERWKQLESNGNPGFLRNLLDTFLNSTPNDLTSLQTASRNMDLRSIVRLAHTLKSSCENLGILGPARMLYRIEKQARTLGRVDVTVVEDIAKDLRQALAELKVDRDQMSS